MLVVAVTILLLILVLSLCLCITRLVTPGGILALASLTYKKTFYYDNLLIKGVDIHIKYALVGGNCNNGDRDGAFYLNIRNTASNNNWNIGACLSLICKIIL